MIWASSRQALVLNKARKHPINLPHPDPQSELVSFRILCNGSKPEVRDEDLFAKAFRKLHIIAVICASRNRETDSLR